MLLDTDGSGDILDLYTDGEVGYKEDNCLYKRMFSRQKMTFRLLVKIMSK